jgi:hypothetical protein
MEPAKVAANFSWSPQRLDSQGSRTLVLLSHANELLLRAATRPDRVRRWAVVR